MFPGYTKGAVHSLWTTLWKTCVDAVPRGAVAYV